MTLLEDVTWKKFVTTWALVVIGTLILSPVVPFNANFLILTIAVLAGPIGAILKTVRGSNSERTITTPTRVRSRGDLILGGVLALLLTLAAVILIVDKIYVAVPVLAVLVAIAGISLVTSWGSRSQVFRGFAVTLVTLTVAAVTVPVIAYLPLMLGGLLEMFF
ncbi:MAG: hypothetical protein ABIS18_02750 [Actinomycetota bacterium]